MTDAPTERGGEGALSKLRHRKVVQWGLGYAAAAWTLLQVIESLVETFSWPPAIRQLATIGLSLSLLIALVLAWYHGERGDQAISKTEAGILVALVALIGGALWWYGTRLDESAWSSEAAVAHVKHVVPSGAPSVAVLPFVNMSADPEQEYFSDGLSEEILNALARIPGLYVPARTSSFQFKGKTGDVARFAALLGVAAVLEGSVRKAGNRVRITAQLVNAADGYRVWSQIYDRDLKDIFAVQREIADAIATSLRLQLTPAQLSSASQAPLTMNTDAYEAFLLGRHEFSKGQAETIAKSVEHFKTAVDLDPKFAVAQAHLAVAIIENSSSRAGIEYSQARARALDEARKALEKAEALEPDRADVLAARGYWERANGHARREGLERALTYFEKSLAQNPSSGQVLTWRNEVLAWLGQFDKMLPASAEALKRDPLSLDVLDFRIKALLTLGRRAEVGPLVERVRSLDEVRGQQRMADLADSDGDRPAVIRYCIAAAQAGGDGGCGWGAFAALGLKEEVLAHAANEAAAHWTLGEVHEAVRLARAAYDQDAAWWEWDLVLWYWVIRDYENSWGFLQRAERSDEQGAGYTGWSRSPILLLAAADSARRLGHAARASEMRDLAEQRIQGKVRAASPFEPANHLERAMLAAFDGHDAEAAEFLARRVRARWEWRLALSMPLFDTVRRRAEFQSAVREQQAVLERQRKEVLAILCGGNPLPEAYRPQPGTCAGHKESAG